MSRALTHKGAWHGLWCLLLWVAASTAWAHSSSTSYLILSEREGASVLRTDLHLRDIDVVFDLDATCPVTPKPWRFTSTTPRIP